MKDRLIYYDLLRAVAIIGVIGIHSTGIGYGFSDSSIDFNLTIFWRQLINFSVPMFISISGFFLGNKELGSKKSYVQFIKKQIPRVLIPYLLWSTLYLGIAFLRGETILDILYRLVTFTSSVPFYFILLIIEYYLLLPFLQKLATPRGVIISALISLLSCALIFYFRYHTNVNLPIFIVGSAPSWLVFFVLGIYLRNNRVECSNRILICALIFSLLLSLLETYGLYATYNDIGNSVSAVKVSSFMYSAFVILFAFKNANRAFNRTKLLAYIGEVSFGIFLSHMLFMKVVRLIIDRFIPALREIAMLHQFVVITFTLVFCLLFAVIVRKIDKDRALKFLGH